MLRDRGNIKWTSLMLPEHVELLKDMWQEDTKVQKPELDEQEMEAMEQRLYHAYHCTESVQLTVYTDGEFSTVTGSIKQINKQTQTFRLTRNHAERTIGFKEIVGVTIL